MCVDERVEDEKSASARSLNGSKAGAISSALRISDVMTSSSERTCGCLSLTHLQHDDRIADIARDCQSAETRDDLAQKLDPLARKIAPSHMLAGTGTALSWRVHAVPDRGWD